MTYTKIFPTFSRSVSMEEDLTNYPLKGQQLGQSESRPRRTRTHITPIPDSVGVCKAFNFKNLIIGISLSSLVIVGIIFLAFCLPHLLASKPPAYNILLVGGQRSNGSSDLSLEVVNIGLCPQGSSNISFPEIPFLGSSIRPWSNYHNDLSAVHVCDKSDYSLCWSFTNVTRKWQRVEIDERFMSHLDGDIDDHIDDDEENAPCSNRHGYATLSISNILYLLGGKSCEGDYPLDVLQFNNLDKFRWKKTNFTLSSGRKDHSVVKLPCDFIVGSEPKFIKLLSLHQRA